MSNERLQPRSEKDEDQGEVALRARRTVRMGVRMGVGMGDIALPLACT